MKVSMKSTVVLLGLVLVFACSLPLSSSGRVGFRNNDSNERVVDVETIIANATDMAYKNENKNANSTYYGGEAQGCETQLAKGINGGPKGAKGGGGSSLQDRCQGGGYSGAQDDCGRGQGGYGGEQGGYRGGKGGSYGGGSLGQGGRVEGGQGGSSSQGGSEGGYVEPKCGELGCCYSKYGKCLECCKPWWVPPGEMNQDVKGKI